MPGYALAPIVLEFPELGPDVRVTILHPLLLPHGASAEAVLQAVSQDVRVSAGETPTIPLSLAGELSRRRIAALVIAWEGVCDPYTQEALPIPRTDPTVIDRIPQIILDRIDAEVALHPNEVPKAKPAR